MGSVLILYIGVTAWGSVLIPAEQAQILFSRLQGDVTVAAITIWLMRMGCSLHSAVFLPVAILAVFALKFFCTLG